MEETLRLIEQEIPRLRRYARFLVRDVDRADDLVQDTLARGIEKLHTWQPGTNLRAWLFVIMRNSFISDIRKDKNAPTAFGLADDNPALASRGDQEGRIAFIDLRSAFGQLPADHREILALVAIEGLKYEEAAAVLNIPIGTVRSRVARARQALRDILEGGREQSLRVVP